MSEAVSSNLVSDLRKAADFPNVFTHQCMPDMFRKAADEIEQLGWLLKESDAVALRANTAGVNLMAERDRLRTAAEGAVKWLMSDPVRGVGLELYARDILLMALGTTQDAFREAFKDQIIRPADETTSVLSTKGD